VSGPEWTLVIMLGVNAALVLGYRLYRLTKGGPMADAIGGAVLAAALVLVALGVAAGTGWVRWAALGYGSLFAVVVMPIWALAVLIPMRPRWPDYTFTALYWLSLIVICIAAVAA
jgi:hypothetical protein